MKGWGLRDQAKPPRRDLLEYVLTWILRDEVNSGSNGFNFRLMLKYGSGSGGDPCWEIDHIPDSAAEGHFRLYADQEYSGIIPEEDIYTIDEIFEGLKEGLVAEAARGPYMFAPGHARREYAKLCEQALKSLPFYRSQFEAGGIVD